MKASVGETVGWRTLRRLAKFSFMCCLAENLLLSGVSAQTVTREAVLRDLARQVIAAGYQDLAANCQALTNAAGQLAETPDQVALGRARQAWAAVAVAANHVRCFQAGPLVEREYAATFYYVRISPPAINGLLQQTNAIDLPQVPQLDGNAKGLFALEYLLFGHKGFPGLDKPDAPLVLERLSGNGSESRRAYLVVLTRDLEAKATQLAQDWSSPGDEGAAAKFVKAGQASVNLLVNQLAHSLEDAQQNHLNFVLVLPQPLARQMYRIEGSPSGTSLQDAVAYLEGVQRFQRGIGGLGLADMLKQANAPLAKRVEDALVEALAATKTIGEPLEQAVQDKRDTVQNACNKIHALEILFKVDLASALGVTISFTSGDGD